MEDYAAVTLRAADGMLGLIEAGYTHPDAGGTYEFRINAERGALVDTGSRLIAVPDRQPLQRPMCHPADDTAPSWPTRWHAWQRAAPPAVSLKEFARATELIDQAYRR